MGKTHRSFIYGAEYGAAMSAKLLCRQFIYVVILSALFVANAIGVTPFIIEDIRVDGLQRITEGTVYNYLPISIGERLTDDRSSEAMRSLFKTGFFEDIKFFRENDVLVILVQERPSIASLNFSGNKDISTDQLTAALKELGLAVGEIFDRSALNKVERGIQEQYFNQGKYGIKIESSVEQVDGGPVSINIAISEGDFTRIHRINLIGNKAFTDQELLQEFQLESASTFNFFGANDQYSKQRLAGDLEALRSYYLDRGYINFSIDSTRVSISPNKRDVYITANLSEGEKYSIKEVSLAGDLVVSEEELRELILIQPGDFFSRKKIAESIEALTSRLGVEGYAFANINAIPDIDEKTRQVALKFFVDPAKRVYVRRVNISGNAKTRDDVLRREIRQMESAWISTEKVDLSRLRLQRLGYFEDVNVETRAVEGAGDLVDVNFNVSERVNTGTLLAGVGYSQDGLLFNASVSMDNFMGTGRKVATEINNSNVNTIYSFSYTNPYYTKNGVSRGFKAYLRETDAGEANVADYTSDVYGGDVNFGIPLSEVATGRFALSYEHSLLETNVNTPQAYIDFINANSDEFDLYKAIFGWSYDSRDRAIFAESGLSQHFSADIVLPGSGLEFYKLSTKTRWFYPLGSKSTLLLRNEIAFGDSYGDTTELPFFERYYAGGGRSVRGFRANTLGPRENNNPIGGAFKVVGNAEFIFSMPFTRRNKSLRTSFFFDAGNVYNSLQSYDSGELRYSTGLALYWLSPIGPFSLSFAEVLNEKEGDDIQRFQFSLGTAF